MKQKIYVGVGIIVAFLVVGMFVSAIIWPVINDVETGATPEYPELQPNYYSAEPVRVFEEAVAVVESLERWEVAERIRANRTLEAERRSRIFGFVDDVTITVEPVTEFVSEVNVRSRSRVGKGDFGQNARNIRKFLGELDDRLGAVKFEPDENGELEGGEPVDSGRDPDQGED